MTFASKKEADAYDKMLDMAEAFTDWLLQSELPLDEAQFENLGLFLAEQKDAVQHILRTSKLPEAQSDNAVPKAADTESSKRCAPLRRPDQYCSLTNISHTLFIRS